ncbi:hypothetical protein PGB90_006883 [Kerria lacca]
MGSSFFGRAVVSVASSTPHCNNVILSLRVPQYNFFVVSSFFQPIHHLLLMCYSERTSLFSVSTVCETCTIYVYILYSSFLSFHDLQ